MIYVTEKKTKKLQKINFSSFFHPPERKWEKFRWKMKVNVLQIGIQLVILRFIPRCDVWYFPFQWNIHCVSAPKINGRIEKLSENFVTGYTIKLSCPSGSFRHLSLFIRFFSYHERSNAWGWRVFCGWTQDCWLLFRASIKWCIRLVLTLVY
jgi:hypothetical protein